MRDAKLRNRGNGGFNGGNCAAWAFRGFPPGSAGSAGFRSGPFLPPPSIAPYIPPASQYVAFRNRRNVGRWAMWRFGKTGEMELDQNTQEIGGFGSSAVPLQVSWGSARSHGGPFSYLSFQLLQFSDVSKQPKCRALRNGEESRECETRN